MITSSSNAETCAEGCTVCSNLIATIQRNLASSGNSTAPPVHLVADLSDAWPALLHPVCVVLAAAFARTKDPSEIIGADVVDEEVCTLLLGMTICSTLRTLHRALDRN